MKNIKITAKYIGDGFIEDPPKDGIYRVRSIDESNSGKKRVWLWGWKASVDIDDVKLMINGVEVKWI